MVMDLLAPQVVFGNGKDNFWTAFGTRNALVYCCGGAKHGEEDSSTQTAASAAASAAAAVIAPTTADGTPKSCAEAEIVQRSLQKVARVPESDCSVLHFLPFTHAEWRGLKRCCCAC